MAGLLVTVPPASAHSYDHVGYAVDLVVAGAIGALREDADPGAGLVVTRDDHSIPAIQAGPAPGLEHLGGIARSLTGGPVALGRTGAFGVQEHARSIWAALDADRLLERRTYERLRCTRCRTSVDAASAQAACPACHGTDLALRSEPNWFLRVSPFADALSTWRERVTLLGPASPLARAAPPPPAELSVSRPMERTDGEGVPVPGDAEQVIHSGFVAACSYLLARPDADWESAERRIQVCGKGLLNLHTTLVPLLCAALGLPAADAVHVHHHVRVEGRSPQAAARQGTTASALLAEHGAEAVRWWILRLGLAKRDSALLLRDLSALAARETPRIRTLSAGSAARPAPASDGPAATAGRLDAQLAALDLGGLCRSLLALPDRSSLDAAVTGRSRERIDRLLGWLDTAGARS